MVLLTALGVHCIFWISLSNGILDPLFNDSTYRIRQGVDFYQFYQAGSSLLDGDSIYRYTPSDELSFAPTNRYPPFMTFTTGLAAQLWSPATAYYMWRVVILCAFVIMLLFLFKIAGTSQFTPILFLSLIYTPYYIDLYLGQTNTLMAMLITLMMYGLVKGRDNLTFVTFAASLNVKLNTLLFLPIFILKKRWMILLKALTVAVILFIPYFFFFPEDLNYFFTWAFGTSIKYFYQTGNLGFYPVIRELVHNFSYSDDLIRIVQTTWSILIMGITLWIQIRTRRSDPLDMVSLWMSAYFVAFKFIWEHHLVMLLPILAVEYLRGNRKTITFLWIILALPTVFHFIDVGLGSGYNELQPFLTGGKSLLYHSCKVIPLILLYVSVVLRLMKRSLSFRTVIVTYCLIYLAGTAVYNFKSNSTKDYCALALMSARQGETSQAESYFEQCIHGEPRYLKGYFHYAKFLIRRGEKQKALKLYREARSLATGEVPPVQPDDTE